MSFIKKQKILIALDDGKDSEWAFEWYRSHLHRPGNIVIIVSCSEIGYRLSRLTHVMVDKNDDVTIDGFIEEENKRMSDKLTKYQHKLRNALMVGQVLTSCHTSPCEIILNTAANEDVTMIVVGCHGDGVYSPSSVGSVCSFLIANSTVPVVVCKDDQTAAAHKPPSNYLCDTTVEPNHIKSRKRLTKSHSLDSSSTQIRGLADSISSMFSSRKKLTSPRLLHYDGLSSDVDLSENLCSGFSNVEENVNEETEDDVSDTSLQHTPQIDNKTAETPKVENFSFTEEFENLLDLDTSQETQPAAISSPVQPIDSTDNLSDSSRLQEQKHVPDVNNISGDIQTSDQTDTAGATGGDHQAETAATSKNENIGSKQNSFKDILIDNKVDITVTEKQDSESKSFVREVKDLNSLPLTAGDDD